MNDEYFKDQAERVRNIASSANPFTKKRSVALAEQYDPAKPSPWHFMRVVLTAIFALGALVPTTSSAQDVVCKSGKVCPKGTVCLEGGMCAEEDQNFSCAAGFRWTGVLCTKTSKECTPKQCPRGESCETDICTEKSCDRTRGHCYAANEIQTCKAGRCPAQAQCAEDGCAWIKGSPTAQYARGNKDSPGRR